MRISSLKTYLSFPGKNTRVVFHVLLQGIFPTRDQTHVPYVSCFGRQVLYHSCGLENAQEITQFKTFTAFLNF